VYQTKNDYVTFISQINAVLVALRRHAHHAPKVHRLRVAAGGEDKLHGLQRFLLYQ
jgi:hypothetical protein